MAGPRSDLISTDCAIHACLASHRPPVVVSVGDGRDGDRYVAEGTLALGQQYLGIVCSRSSPLLRALRRRGSFALTVLPEELQEGSWGSWREADQIPARTVSGTFVRGGTLYLECLVDRTVERLGDSVLVLAGVVAAWQEAPPDEQGEARRSGEAEEVQGAAYHTEGRLGASAYAARRLLS